MYHIGELVMIDGGEHHGQYMRVKAVNDDGSPELEFVEARDNKSWITPGVENV